MSVRKKRLHNKMARANTQRQSHKGRKGELSGRWVAKREGSIGVGPFSLFMYTYTHTESNTHTHSCERLKNLSLYCREPEPM